MQLRDLEPSEGPDTALARALHASGALDLATLRACLEDARAGSRGLAELLLERELLDEGGLSRAFAEQPLGREGPLHLGEVVAGRYQVGELLGQGGMGAVYGVRELSGRRDLALKVILPEVASEVDLQRFRQEGEIAARLGAAQGFVVVHAAGEHRGLSWFVMERVEGRDLEAALAAGLPLSRLVEVLVQVARSLQGCHEQGIVHRDLKPANVLLTPGGPKIADLGLARGRDRETLTQTGELLGTPAYMAPEQLVDARQVDARTDVYALGAILYRGLTGRPPFSGPLFQVLHEIASKDPPRPRELAPAAPAGLEAVCARAMAKEPAARYASALELAEALEGAGAAAPPARPALGAALLVVGALALLLVAAVGAPRPGVAPRAGPSETAPREGSRAGSPPGERRLSASDRAQLAALISNSLATPVRLGRDAAAWGERLALGWEVEALRAQKRALWLELRPALSEQIAASPDPGLGARRLIAVLQAPPPVRQGLAPLCSQVFSTLGARYRASESKPGARDLAERAYQEARALQLARLAHELGPPPRWLQEVALTRRWRGRGLIDCLQLDVFLKPMLNVSSYKGFASRSGERSWTVGEGRVALYLELARFGQRDVARSRQLATRVVELWRSLPRRARDLGAGYTLEVEVLGLRAATSLLARAPRSDPQVSAERARLLARCRSLRASAHHWGIYELALTEQALRKQARDPAGIAALWEAALRRLDEDRDRPRGGVVWNPDQVRWRILVSLGAALLGNDDPRGALRVRDELADLRPQLGESLRLLSNSGEGVGRAIELDRARLEVGACARLGEFERAEATYERYGVEGIRDNPDLGVAAAELYLRWERPREAERVIEHVGRYKGPEVASWLEGRLRALTSSR